VPTRRRASSSVCSHLQSFACKRCVDRFDANVSMAAAHSRWPAHSSLRLRQSLLFNAVHSCLGSFGGHEFPGWVNVHGETSSCVCRSQCWHPGCERHCSRASLTEALVNRLQPAGYSQRATASGLQPAGYSQRDTASGIQPAGYSQRDSWAAIRLGGTHSGKPVFASLSRITVAFFTA